jgi:hypothetical protein
MRALLSTGVAIAIVSLAALWIMRDPQAARDAAHRTAAGPAAHSQRDVAGTPRALAPAIALNAAAPAVVVSSSLRDYVQARDWKGLYDRLQGTARSPEDNWILATILGRCAANSDHPPPQRIAQSRAVLRERYASSISMKDPSREKRIAAFERSMADPCVGLRDMKTTDAEIQRLIEAAADAGDPKAKVSRMQRERMELERRNGENGEPSPDWLTEVTLKSIKDVVATRDPEALNMVPQLLIASGPHSSLRAGPEESSIDMTAFFNAWSLVACDLGRPCGADTNPYDFDCISRGICESRDARERILNSSTPAQAQMIVAYYTGINRAVYNGDWSYFTLFNGPSTMMATMPDVSPPKPPPPPKADAPKS